MNLECSACGTRFRSMIAESRHRHNFPALCKRNKRFLAWSAERNVEAITERILSFPIGTLFYIVTSDQPTGPHVVYQRTVGDQMDCVVNMKGERSDMGPFDVRNNVPKHWLRIDLPTEAEVDAYHMLRAHALDHRAATAFSRTFKGGSDG